MSSAMWLLVRRSLTTNRRAVLGLALVIALAGAVALTSVAAARRTQSAFPRYLDRANASEVAVNVVSDTTFEGGDTSDPSMLAAFAAGARARGLAGIESESTYVGLEDMFLVDEDGEPLPFQGEVVGSVDGRFFEQDRLAVLEGRLPDQSRLDEVAINQASAEDLDLEVGSTIRFVVVDIDSLEEGQDPADFILARTSARVTGIGLFPEEVLSDEYDGSPRVLTTPAFTAEYVDLAGSYLWHGLRLAPGTSVDEVIREFNASLDEGYQTNIQRSDTQIDRVARSVRPVVVALAVFGAAAALATLVLGGLGAFRLMAGAAGADAQVHRALGLSRGRRQLLAAAPGVAAAAVGGLGAIVLAVALSPMAPVGPVRQVEPDRGVDLDATVVLLGGALLVVLLAGTTLLAARRATRPPEAETARAARPSRLVAALAGAGFGPNAVVGAGHALGAGGRGDGVPTRATLAACTVSVVAIASALTFGGSVRSLVDTPPSYGWAADLAVDSGGGYDFFDPEAAEDAARAPGIEALSVAGFASVTVDDREINTIGLQAAVGEPIVTIVRGELPVQPTEIALGATTARDLGVDVGDEVAIDGAALQVVGIAALPAIGPLASAHPSLGQGALMTLEGLLDANDNAYPTLALLRVDEGVDLADAAETTRLRMAVASAMSESPPDFASSYGTQRPSEVVGLGPASRTAHLLAALLGVAAVLALVLTLSASVRRRRRTYSVLSALGFERADLRRTVRWQLNVVTLLALVIGLPVGIVLGRVAWQAFADQLGVVGDPRVPVALIGAVAIALLVVCNLVGELPARTAGRRRWALQPSEQL